MKTLRIQYEGENRIIAILTKREAETSENFNKRHVSKCNELQGRIVRAKVMGISIMGDVSHETIYF